MGFLLYVISIVLYLVLLPVNLIVVLIKYSKNKGFFNSLSGYFRVNAVSVDRFGNSAYRTLFNLTLINKDGYQFGSKCETISSVLGKNQLAGTLSRCGKVIVYILNKIQKNHCILSIEN
jgi:hypothetical protein